MSGARTGGKGAAKKGASGERAKGKPTKGEGAQDKSTKRKATKRKASTQGGPSQDPARAAVAVDERVERARQDLLEGVGAEIAASFPGITRLGGQVVAALYLADGPRSMDALCQVLGRSKSNIFTNLKGLEALGIVRRRREAGMRHDSFALNGAYPDVIVGAYIARLRYVVSDKRALARRALGLLGDAQGAEADTLRARLDEVLRKYDLFATIMTGLPEIDGPVDLERLLSKMTPELLMAIQKAAGEAWSQPE